ncbi:hypothetical protein [Streptomyces sp. NPDC012888]|uniref:hypothetical protein n=1 Tax=Streptomyces sp. NPDC012888 TaxID=3364855 RepID=UPI0036BDC265
MTTRLLTIPTPKPRIGPPMSDLPAAVRAVHTAGDLPTAVVLAHRLEAQLEADHGPGDPATVTVLTTRARPRQSERPAPTLRIR